MERRWCFTAFERPLGTLNECARPSAAYRDRLLPGVRMLKTPCLEGIVI